MHLIFGHLWYKPTGTHEWVLFTSFANVMTGCGCTQYDESSKFIIVKGIIRFKHNSETLSITNQLTRQGTVLQVALLVGKHTSWFSSEVQLETFI